MPIFAIAVVLSACLLFLVQPLIAKIILPWFGGASAVWSAALVFFQGCVLAGYAYAHWLTMHASPRMQSAIHTALLLAACVLMPILPSADWRPTPQDDPTWQILSLLAANVGLPAVMLCATSPLLQVWYMRTRGSAPPYWLFALSNAGSLLALLSFPLLLEPTFDSHTLALAWSALFVLFAALCIGTAWLSRRGAEAPIVSAAAAQAPSVGRMALWVLLAACASALLVTVSAHLSTNVAPIPLLWVLPLALYLLTFILSFASPRLYNRTALFPWLAAALGVMGYLYVQGDANLHIQYVIPLYLAGLFVCCLACHGELVYWRPAPAHLTRFYLLIALGGALGGLFVALLAPVLFATYLEFPLVLTAIAVVYAALQWRRRGSIRTLWLVRAAMLTAVLAFTGYLARAEYTVRQDNLLVARNFYGVLRVQDYLPDSELASRHLLHGTISHGSQFLTDMRRYLPGAYFSIDSGVGRTLLALQSDGPVRCGVIGLGAGVLASYSRSDDYLRIYELNPAVLRIANEYFTFLDHAQDIGADTQVLLGDGRLVLENQPAQNFDLLIVDAFSSDAIPAHLLTREAMEVYFRHLQPDGVLAVHISNRYLDLVPVTARAAEHVDRPAYVVRNPSDGQSNASVWVLITSDLELLQRPAFEDANIAPAAAEPGFKGWTDQYSSLWPVLKRPGAASEQFE